MPQHFCIFGMIPDFLFLPDNVSEHTKEQRIHAGCQPDLLCHFPDLLFLILVLLPFLLSFLLSFLPLPLLFLIMFLLFHSLCPAEKLRDGKDAVLPAFPDIIHDFTGIHAVKFGVVQMHMAGFQGTDSLEQALLHGAPDAHDLSCRFHLCGKGVIDLAGVWPGKFVKGETGHLGDDIIKRWFKTGRRVGEHDLIQGHTDADLGGNPGDGIAAGLGGKGRGARHAGIHFDQIILERLWIQRKLHIAAALNLQCPDHSEGTVAEHVVLLVGQGLRGTDDDRVTGMDSNRVNIFHITDGDGCVVTVTHDFVFNLFISLNAFFNQHLMDRRQLQGVFHDRAKGFFVSGKTASCTSQCKGGTQNDRIADLVRRCKSLFHAVGDFRGQDRLPQGLAEFFKKKAVFGPLNGTAPGSQKFRLAFSKHTLFFQLHGQVEAGLAANAGKNGVGTLVADDLGHVFQSQGLHIDLIRNRCVRHDRRRIGVAQDHLISFFLQGKAGLGSGIIKLCRLPDHNRT